MTALAGEGSQRELAESLMVTPARITQLKDELAQRLGSHGYRGPLIKRAASLG